jgi:hypothetical protein
MDVENRLVLYCEKPLRNKGRFPIPKRCFKLQGHSGSCADFGYLAHIDEAAAGVGRKIRRDATKTTGASWRSKDAGPNRIDRWAMLLSDSDLLGYDLDVEALSPGVQAKLRDKRATYDDCIEVAQKLAWHVYNMRGAPAPPPDIRDYLEQLFGSLGEEETACMICGEPLEFEDFARAVRGKAEIETAHANPRAHNADNVGFAHRICNIAQGPRTLDEFYAWMESVLRRVRRI